MAQFSHLSPAVMQNVLTYLDATALDNVRTTKRYLRDFVVPYTPDSGGSTLLFYIHSIELPDQCTATLYNSTESTPNKSTWKTSWKQEGPTSPHSIQATSPDHCYLQINNENISLANCFPPRSLCNVRLQQKRYTWTAGDATVKVTATTGIRGNALYHTGQPFPTLLPNIATFGENRLTYPDYRWHANLQYTTKCGLLHEENCIQKETNSPILGNNRKYLPDGISSFFAEATQWPHLIGVDVANVPKVEDVPVEKLCKGAECIGRDIPRIFIDEEHREDLGPLIRHLAGKLGEYAQGMGQVTGLLRLFYSADVTAALIQGLEKREVTRYWAWESTSSATDANTFFHIVLKKSLPEVAKKLADSMILPEMYLQIYFVSFGIPALPLSCMGQMLSGLFQDGLDFLFRVVLRLHFLLKDLIMEKSQIHELLGILRLATNMVPETLVTPTTLFSGLEKYDIPTNWRDEREEIYNVHLKARMERAAAARLAAEEEDDDDEFWEEDEEDED